jgi:hypothetical protein
MVFWKCFAVRKEKNNKVTSSERGWGDVKTYFTMFSLGEKKSM